MTQHCMTEGWINHEWHCILTIQYFSNRPVDSAEVRPQDGSVQSTASNRGSNHGENRRFAWAVGNEVHRRNDRLNAENSNAKRMPRGGRLREGVNKFGQNQELNVQGQPVNYEFLSNKQKYIIENRASSSCWRIPRLVPLPFNFSADLYSLNF